MSISNIGDPLQANVLRTGNAIAYIDLNFDPARSGGPVATRPVEVKIGNVYYAEFDNGNNEEGGAVEEIPHEVVQGGTGYIHLHMFLKSGESVGTTGVEFTIYWEQRHGSTVTNGSVVLSATSAELTGNDIVFKQDGTGISLIDELGVQLALTIARTDGDAGDVVVPTYGVHLPVDEIGSVSMSSKT